MIHLEKFITADEVLRGTAKRPTEGVKLSGVYFKRGLRMDVALENLRNEYRRCKAI